MRISHLLSATALLGVLAATPAIAQVITTTQAPTPDAEQTQPLETVEESQDGLVVVTGSRIRRPNYDTVEPSVTINADYLANRGITNVAQAINELPGVRGSTTQAGDQSSFGVGVNFSNALGLGSNRTLTLINGRRVVSSNTPTIFGPANPGLQVDLNIVPSQLVSTIDQLSIGGAPTYGSDAIAGVVNVILRQKFEGLEVSGLTGITERGDNMRLNGNFIYGTNFADGRGNITLTAAYDREEGVLSTARERASRVYSSGLNPSAAQAALLNGRTPATDGRTNPNIPYNASATDGVPASIIYADRRVFVLARGGVIGAALNSAGQLTTNSLVGNLLGSTRVIQTAPVQFDGSGNLVPFTIGSRYGAPFNLAAGQANVLTSNGIQQGGPIDASGGDGLNLAEFGQITSDLERINVAGTASFDVDENTQVFLEGLYYRGKARELVNQPVYNALAFGGVSAPLRFTIDNPFLTDQARSVLQAAGTQTFFLSRASADLVTPRPEATNDLMRFVGGTRHNFMIGERKFDAEVSVNYGKSTASFLDSALDQQRFANAVNVTRNAAGQIVCNPNVTAATNAAPGGVLPVADSACQPLNLFGEGRASQAALDYVTVRTLTKTRQEQLVVNANVGGTLFDIWGGGVAFNAGYEFRREKAAFTPDPFLVAGRGRSVAILPTTGTFSVNEFFGEVSIPLVSPANNIPLIRELEIIGRARHVDNTVNGGFLTWTAGGRWAPIRDIQFRGNFTRSFRAPAIAELFSQRTNIFTTVPDLCTPANQLQGADPATRQRNCAAFLARFPTATPLQAASATVPGLSGGNPNLQNEVADAYTFGAVIRPTFLPRFNLSVDYLNVKISGPITSLNATAIATACFDNPVFDANDPANGNQFCSLIRRGPDGQVVNDPTNPGVNTSFINGVETSVDGIQVSFDYNFPVNLGPRGRIALSSRGLWINRRLPNITGVAPQRTDTLTGDPEFSVQGNIGYDDDFGGIFTSVNWDSATFTSRTATIENSEYIKYRAEYFVNAGIYAKFAESSRFTIAVTNLFDNNGQFPRNLDPLGRRFTVGINHRF